MDWTALWLSVELALWTTVVILPLAVLVGRILAWRRFFAKGLIEALIALPLVLPPTVLGYYLLTALGSGSPIGQAYSMVFDRPLVFTFQGLLVASVIFNIPFAVQPIQRAFESVPAELREAAWCSGLSRWRTFRQVEFPLAWTGILTGFVLTFAHTVGEFGVVLMVGGNIPGATRTVAVSIYDRVQAFDDSAAHNMSVLLLVFSFLAIGAIYLLSNRNTRRNGR